MTISVVIPTLNAGGDIERCLRGLANQTRRPDEILVIDSASDDATPQRAAAWGARVLPIARRNFNHGGTRNLGVAETSGEVVVFLTQDANPVDPGFLEALTTPLLDGRASAAFARQEPHPEAWPSERLARAWNYPPQSEWRHRDERERWGLRYVFFSNVASAVRRDRFDAVGRFPEALIMNEDVVLAARLLEAGDTVAYLAEARVEHSHNYSLGQQFRRSFDIGVFHARHAELIPEAGTTGEGLRFVRHALNGLVVGGHWAWIPRFIIETGLRFCAFHLGKREHLLCRDNKRRLAMHRGYFAPGARAA